MGWNYIILAAIGSLSLLLILVYTRLKVLEAHTPLVLDAWKTAEKAALVHQLATEAYKSALVSEAKIKGLEEWAQALTAHAQGGAEGNLQEQIDKIVGMGAEDFQKDLDQYGFDSDPGINPEDTV